MLAPISLNKVNPIRSVASRLTRAEKAIGAFMRAIKEMGFSIERESGRAHYSLDQFGWFSRYNSLSSFRVQ